MIAQVTALLLAPLAAFSAERTGVLDRQWVALPTFPVKKEVAPSGGDDSAAIQAAIGEVSALPLVNGSRGAVLLKPGVFNCAKPITLAREGVVLRGSGSGSGGTSIKLTGKPQGSIFIIEGSKMSSPKATPAHTYLITDKYVPAGTLSLSVRDAKRLAVGDNVCIRWPRSAKWIHFMDMDTLVRNGKSQTWIKEDSQATMDRLIRAIDGNRITLDVPLTEAIDAQSLLFEMPPGALNLAIGCKGEPGKKSSKEAFFSANKPRTPACLYLAQLRERLGEMAVKNIGY